MTTNTINLYAIAVQQKLLPIVRGAVRTAQFLRFGAWRFQPLKRHASGVASALLTYAAIVLSFNHREILAWHHIIEFLYPALGAAWGIEHALAALAAFFVYRFVSTPPDIYQDRTIFLRGRQLVSYESALARAKALLRTLQPYLWWGMLPIKTSEAVKNFLVVGRPGSGKSVAIELLLKSFVPTIGRLPEFRTRMLLYDAKSDMWPILAAMKPSCPIYTLNIDHPDVMAWDMASDIRSPGDAKEAAAIFVPDHLGNDNKFFSDYTRLLFQGVMESFILSSPGKWTLRDVLLALKSPGRAKAVLSRHPQTKDILDNLSDQRVRYNVFSSVQIERDRYSIIAATWHKIWKDKSRRLSLSEWVNGESILLLGQATSEGSPLRGLNQLIIQRLSELLNNRPNSKVDRTWFVLDELTDLKYVRGLDLILRRGRSKGVASVLGFQTWPGLVNAFGPELAKQITALCSYKSFLAVDDPETAEWAAAHFGDYETLEYRVSYSVSDDDGSGSRSLSIDQRTRPSVMPAELLTLPPTNEQHGFVGYHLSPQFQDGYKVYAPWGWTMGHLVPENAGGPRQWSSNEKAAFQYLPDWDDGECVELGLPPVKQMDSPDEKPKEMTDLADIRNLKREDFK